MKGPHINIYRRLFQRWPHPEVVAAYSAALKDKSLMSESYTLRIHFMEKSDQSACHSSVNCKSGGRHGLQADVFARKWKPQPCLL